MVSWIYRLAAFTVILLIAVSAQAKVHPEDTYSFDFRGDPLDEVLKEIAHATDTDLVYDPQLLEDEVVYERVSDKTVPELLSKILNDTHLDYITLSSGTMVIVEAPEEDAAFGSFAGKVKDEKTGEPLPGATIKLADASGGTTANRNGNFSISGMMSGTYRIVFSYIGYEPVEKTIEITPDNQTEEEVELAPEPVDFTPVIITGHQPKLAGISSGQPMETESDWEPAGGRADAIRSLSLLSGVQYGLPMQDLHIQGGHRSEQKMRLDGVPVYNPYSFGQMFSAFSPMAIGDVHLHKAGYGAEQGSQIAGIVDLHHESVTDGQNQGLAQGDPLSINLRGDLSVEDDDGGFKLMGALRTNYWNLYQDPTLKQTLQEWDYVDPLLTNRLLNPHKDIAMYEPAGQESDVQFLDGHLSASYEFDTYNTLRASVYSGQNYLANSHLGEVTADESDYDPYLFARDGYDWNNLIGQISWDTRLTPRSELSTMVGYSYSRMDHQYHISTTERPFITQSGRSGFAGAMDAYFQTSEELLETHNAHNRMEHLMLRSDGNYSFSPDLSLDAGLDLNLVSSTVDFSDYFLSYSWPRFRQHSMISSIYSNLNYAFGDGWDVTAGSRLTHLNSNHRIFAEPRFSVQYDESESAIGFWSAKLSGGLYRQFINQFEITNVGPTSQVPSLTVWAHAMDSDIPSAYHLSGSWIFHPTPQTSLELEGYYKWQPTAYITSHQNFMRSAIALSEQSVASEFAETTQMESFGGSIRLHQEFWDSRIALLTGYDYSSSRRNLEQQFGGWQTTPWNEPHRFQFRSLFRITENLSSVIKWQSIFGRSWGFRQAYYDYLNLHAGERTYGDFDFTNPEADILEPFHQLDFSLIYRPTLGSVDVDLRLDLINLLNRRNTLDWGLQPEDHVSADSFETDGYEIRKRQLPGFYPSVSLEVGL